MLTKYGSADIDFLLPSIGPSGLRVPLQPMSYAEGLYFLRRFLSLPWKQKPLSVGTSPSSYTIHGLKSTLISWATQLDLSDEHKRLQGKHQARNSSTRLYSRDDVHGAIKLQQTIIQAIHGGWRPVTPLSRGGQIPLVEPDFALERYNKTAPDHSWGSCNFMDKALIGLNKARHFQRQKLTRWKRPPLPTQVRVTALPAPRRPNLRQNPSEQLRLR